MSLFAKIMVVVNFVLAVAFLAAAGTFLGAAEDYKARYMESEASRVAEVKDLEAQIQARRQELETLNEQIRAVEKEAVASTSQLQALQTSNAELNRKNQQLEASLNTLATAQKDLQDKNVELNASLDRTRNELSAAEQARRAKEDENKTHIESIARLETALADAEKALAASETNVRSTSERLAATETTVAMYKQKFGALSDVVSMKDVKGVVQAASAEDDIYIISVGSKDQVQVGYEFTVFRGNEYISTIVIDKVFPDKASGRTKAGMRRKPIVAGDEVATRL